MKSPPYDSLVDIDLDSDDDDGDVIVVTEGELIITDGVLGSDGEFTDEDFDEIDDMLDRTLDKVEGDKIDSEDADLDLYECDCGFVKATLVSFEPFHYHYCDLWESWEFQKGWAVWDCDTKKLRALADSEFEGPRPPEPTKDPRDDRDLKNKSTKWTTSTTFTQKCRHYQQVLLLPNGVKVYASSHSYKRGKDEFIPDLGIYMDGCWTPDCVAFYVGCPDYGIPVPSMASVLHIAREGIRVATDGGKVEMGCIGGHGRTGLMLAVMAIITSHGTELPLDGDEAVHYIRKVYCNHAVESERQIWFLRCVHAELNGLAWPAEPKPPKVVVTKTKWKSPTTAKAGPGPGKGRKWNTTTLQTWVDTDDPHGGLVPPPSVSTGVPAPITC